MTQPDIETKYTIKNIFIGNCEFKSKILDRIDVEKTMH